MLNKSERAEVQIILIEKKSCFYTKSNEEISKNYEEWSVVSWLEDIINYYCTN